MMLGAKGHVPFPSPFGLALGQNQFAAYVAQRSAAQQQMNVARNGGLDPYSQLQNMRSYANSANQLRGGPYRPATPSTRACAYCGTHQTASRCENCGAPR